MVRAHQIAVPLAIVIAQADVDVGVHAIALEVQRQRDDAARMHDEKSLKPLSNEFYA